MTTVKRPRRLFSFSDYQKSHPSAPPPGDRLDEMFIELSEALRSTQEALAQIRRDDGMLNNHLVTAHTLSLDVQDHLAEAIIAKVEPTRQITSRNAIAARQEAVSAQTSADEAHRSAIATAQFLAASQAVFSKLAPNVAQANVNAKSAEIDAIDAENWATYSEAQASNAIAAKDEAMAWAEFLAGPVVSHEQAPDFIDTAKFGYGLFYQPVEGAGGMGGLWSAKWWAIYAQQLVGNISFYYLGPSNVPLVPGSTNPITGITVPNPLAVGSFYYDTTTNTVMVWNGTAWQEPGVKVAAGYSANYYYVATAGQTVFSGADINGKTPAITDEVSNVHLNGVRLVPTLDYATDAALDKLTLVEAPGAGAVVQWDLLLPPDKVGSKKLDAFKLQPLVPDGTKVSFALSYIDPSNGQPYPTTVGTGAQLLISLDGIVQEPGVDYSAINATLTMVTAPRADSKLWGVWYAPYDVVVP